MQDQGTAGDGHAQPAGSAESVVLLRRAKHGEREAYEALFARYYPRVLAITRARLGGRLRDFVAAEDVAQEAMLRAIRSFDRFELRSDASLIGWFARIVENQVRDAWRRAQVRRPAAARGEGGSQGDPDEQAGRAEPAAEGTRTLSRLARRDEADLLQNCLAELEPLQRELIVRRVLQGSPWSQIATELGLSSDDAARMAFARAKLALGRILGRRLE